MSQEPELELGLEQGPRVALRNLAADTRPGKTEWGWCERMTVQSSFEFLRGTFNLDFIFTIKLSLNRAVVIKTSMGI